MSVVRRAPARRREAVRAANGRVQGVDVARALALLAMMCVHVLPELDRRGAITPAFSVAAGRASALFALLAGVGLALGTGGERPRLRPRRAVAASVLTRALLIALLGLALGQLDPPVAVILTNYGLLFALAWLFLGLRPPSLLVIAAGWVVLVPLLSHLLRRGLAPGPGAQPSFSELAHPLGLLTRLALTGYYPVLVWTAYLLVGLAVGRLPLRRASTAAWLAVCGLALASSARLASDLLLAVGGGWSHLLAAGPLELVQPALGLDQLQLRGRYGTAPTTTWWWQAVVSPHTGTPFDLAQTIGSALLVLGLALLLSGWVAGTTGRRLRLVRGLVRALAATGSMTLTLYSLHVLVLAEGVGPAGRVWLLLANVAGALVLATLWRAVRGRGPLEAVVSWASRGAAGLVR